MTTESREQDHGSARASRKSRGSPAIIEAGGSGALDTSGHVGPFAVVRPSHRPFYYWSDLDAFTQGYIEAVCQSQSVGGNWIGCLQTSTGDIHKCTFRDLAAETLARIIADCADCKDAPDCAPLSDTADTGKMFWDLRQARQLPRWPPLTPYLGDDGRVYLREQS